MFERAIRIQDNANGPQLDKLSVELSNTSGMYLYLLQLLNLYICQIELVDFGATRSYSKTFMDMWLRLLTAAANDDVGACVEWSLKLGYLTGNESEVCAFHYLRPSFMYLSNNLIPDAFNRRCSTRTPVLCNLLPPPSSLLRHSPLRSGPGVGGQISPQKYAKGYR